MKFSMSPCIFSLLILAAACNAQKATVAAKSGSVSWTRFSDPLEQAFSMEVPAGWTVRGGLYRKGVLDPRIMVDVTSPDGRITYRIGDAGIPPFTIPTPMGMQLGFREGVPYSPGGRVQGMMARYRNGTQFANLYAQAHYGRTCRNIAVKSMRQANPLMRIGLTGDNAGEVVFTCDGAVPMAGYVYAQSSLSGSVRDGMWGIPIIYSFVAPQGQAKTAMELMTHSVSSYRENPQWTQYQNALIQQANGQIRQEFQANIDLAHRQAQQADQQLDLVHRQTQRADSQLKLSQDFNDIINGETLTRDPTTGQTREVLTGPNQNYWVNGAGAVANTATDTQPGPNYRRLQTITRGQQ